MSKRGKRRSSDRKENLIPWEKKRRVCIVWLKEKRAHMRGIVSCLSLKKRVLKRIKRKQLKVVPKAKTPSSVESLKKSSKRPIKKAAMREVSGVFFKTRRVKKGAKNCSFNSGARRVNKSATKKLIRIIIDHHFRNRFSN